eukprot:TRINITY_DN10029_c0_g1_i1.p1 TRINITY_DN10029_c0_g1~~TRINITY_DN10029_c0_g1_i1.p1  ORF type:complete len:151 (-),score=20.01 TRINITY_DN10029_c0_g1_i1:16-468(-)
MKNGETHTYEDSAREIDEGNKLEKRTLTEGSNSANGNGTHQTPIDSKANMESFKKDKIRVAKKESILRLPIKIVSFLAFYFGYALFTIFITIPIYLVIITLGFFWRLLQHIANILKFIRKRHLRFYRRRTTHSQNSPIASKRAEIRTLLQ